MTSRGPAATPTADGEKIARITRLRANIATIVSNSAATATPEDVLPSPNGLASSAAAAGVVHQAAQEGAEVNAARAVELEQDVVHEADAGNHDDDDPSGARIEQLPGVHEAIRDHGINHEAEQAEHDRAADFFEFEAARKFSQLELPGEQHGDDDCRGHRSEHVADAYQISGNEHQEQRQGGGQFERLRGKKMAKVQGGNQTRHAEAPQ